MKLIGLSRALPISTTYPFFTLMLALLFLDEELGWALFAGALLIAAGAYLLAFPRGAVQTVHGKGEQGLDLAGVGLAFVAAICWGGSTVLLRVGLEGMDVLVANVIRLTVLSVVLFAMLLGRDKTVRTREGGWRSLGIVFLAGIIGTGLGTYVFLASVQEAGAAKTSVLTAITPLFGVPLSLILRERLSGRTVLGTVLTVVGVGLTIY
jgi:DME family drug/metabolite transporter